MTAKISIIDYRMGNLSSVQNALEHLGAQTEIIHLPEQVLSAQVLLLPGVGAFGEAMDNLKALGLIEPLKEKVMVQKTFFLGICLGMQLIATNSEEKGLHQGLGWIDGEVRKVEVPANLRLPHMGWNNLEVKGSPRLYQNLGEDKNFYFVHTFHLRCDPGLITATCEYGENVTASIQKDNIWATQFHPEKSHVNGKLILKNFLEFANSTC